ncbi:MAG: hypothetical protein KJ002_12125, partial [Candidatus Dadabacteria bacterium]|nr:hypothetical protein [Candidatus Dadabacteria bacterium]
APIQCDVDGIPKGPHHARIPPIGSANKVGPPLQWGGAAMLVIHSDPDDFFKLTHYQTEYHLILVFRYGKLNLKS